MRGQAALLALCAGLAWTGQAGADVIQAANELRRQLQYDAASQRLATALPDLQDEPRAQALILLAAVNTDPREARRQLLDAARAATGPETRLHATVELARLDYGRGNYKSAQARLVDFATDPQAAAWLGLTTVALGGSPDLRQILEPARRTDLGQLLTGWADLQSGDAKRALASLEPLAERRRGDCTATALLWKAQCETALGDRDAALQTSATLHERFPDSPEAAQVESQLAAARADVASGAALAPARLALQVEAFEDRTNALRFREHVAHDVPSVRIDEVESSRGRLYRVVVGAFATRDEAETFGREQLAPRGFAWSIVQPGEDSRP